MNIATWAVIQGFAFGAAIGIALTVLYYQLFVVWEDPEYDDEDETD